MYIHVYYYYPIPFIYHHTQVHSDVKKILLKEDAPLPKVLGVRLWQKAIPQYDK
jgi:hypothetical protein